MVAASIRTSTADADQARIRKRLASRRRRRRPVERSGLDEVDLGIAAQRWQRVDLGEQCRASPPPAPSAPARLPCITPRRHAREQRRQSRREASRRRHGHRSAATPRRSTTSIGSRAIVGKLELRAGEQLAVELRRVPQLGVGALGDDATFVENEHAVGQAQRRRSVGDQDRRARAEVFFQRVVDGLFGARVDGRRCVVEHEHRRVGERGAGERDALPLAARQREPPLADHGVVAVRELEDELVGLRHARRGLDLGIARARTGEGDVLPDGRREEEALLEHDVDRAAQRRQRELADVGSVEPHRFRCAGRRSGR